MKRSLVTTTGLVRLETRGNRNPVILTPRPKSQSSEIAYELRQLSRLSTFVKSL